MRNIRLVAVLALVIVCAIGAVVVAHFRNAEALSGEDGRVINIKVGETYTVVLDSNPSTGYSWQPAFDTALLELVNQEFTASSTMLGASGQEHIEFKALAKGTAEVRFAYQRAWEGNAERVVTYRFIIK